MKFGKFSILSFTDVEKFMQDGSMRDQIKNRSLVYVWFN